MSSDRFAFGPPSDPRHPFDPYGAVPAPVDEPWGAPQRRRRAQGVAWVALILAVVGATLMGVMTYFALAAVRISIDPFGVALTWAAGAGTGALISMGAFVTTLVALVVCRPRHAAVVALVAAVVLPLASLFIAVPLGVSVLRVHMAEDVGDGMALAGATVRALDEAGVEAGPLRDVLIAVAGEG